MYPFAIVLGGTQKGSVRDFLDVHRHRTGFDNPRRQPRRVQQIAHQRRELIGRLLHGGK